MRSEKDGIGLLAKLEFITMLVKLCGKLAIQNILNTLS